MSRDRRGACDMCGRELATYRSRCTCVVETMARAEALEARIAQLEQDMDPRTASGEALDRWARLIGRTVRRADETDVELRARIENPNPWLVSGRCMGKTRASAKQFAAMLGIDIDDESEALRERVREVYRPELLGLTSARATGLPPGVLALAVGTRVLIDDKAHPCHGREGLVIGYAPGGEIEIGFDPHGARPETTSVAHRSQLALLDDAPDIEHPPCSACAGTGRGCADCKGTGTYTGFGVVERCKTCGGARCEPCGGSGC